MIATLLDCIAWLSKQKDGLYEVKPYKEKRSLNQNRLYWECVGLMAEADHKPKCYYHNLLLRRCDIYEQIDGKIVMMPLPDTDAAETWAEYHELYHYKPTLSFYNNPETGDRWRWYRVLRGSKTFNKQEMTRLIDIALDEMRNMELYLPQDKAFLKALEEHEKNKKEVKNG